MIPYFSQNIRKIPEKIFIVRFIGHQIGYDNIINRWRCKMFDFLDMLDVYEDEMNTCLSEEEWEATMDARSLWGFGEIEGSLC